MSPEGRKGSPHRGSLSWDLNGREKSDIIEINLTQILQSPLCFQCIFEFSVNPCIVSQIHHGDMRKILKIDPPTISGCVQCVVFDYSGALFTLLG